MKEPIESSPRIFGKVYHCWRDGVYLGEATFEDDPNIGPAFISMGVTDKGLLVNNVLIPDKILLKEVN